MHLSHLIYCSPLVSASAATLVSFWFLKHAKYSPTSGPLHVPSSQMVLSPEPHGSLLPPSALYWNLTFLKKLSLTALFKIATPALISYIFTLPDLFFSICHHLTSIYLIIYFTDSTCHLKSSPERKLWEGRVVSAFVPIPSAWNNACHPLDAVIVFELSK